MHYYGKIYYLPSDCLFYRSYTSVVLSNLRKKYVFLINRKITHNESLNKFVWKNTTRQVFTWSPYSSMTSLDTTQISSETSSLDSEWVDMKKLVK